MMPKITQYNNIIIYYDLSANIILKLSSNVVLTEIRLKKNGKRQIISRYERRYRTMEDWRAKERVNGRPLLSFRRC